MNARRMIIAGTILFLFFISILSFPNNISAQSNNVSGKWVGTLTQPGKTFPFQLSILQDDNILRGSSKITDGSYYGVMSFTGSISGNSVSIQEIAIAESSITPGFRWCIKTLNINLDSNQSVLQGTWTDPGCNSGSLNVVKAPEQSGCSAAGGIAIADGICGIEQAGVKLAYGDLNNPDIKIALATEILSQNAGTFRLRAVENLAIRNTPAGVGGDVVQHHYVAINGTAFDKDCFPFFASCEGRKSSNSIYGFKKWVYGESGGGLGDATKLDTVCPSFFSYSTNIATIHRARVKQSACPTNVSTSDNQGDFDQGDSTYITNVINNSEFSVGYGRTILDDSYVPGNDSPGSKSAIGVSRDGKRVFIAVGDTSSENLANVLKNAGAYRAVLLDGGGSPQMTSVSVGGEDFEYRAFWLYPRRVINGIVLYNSASMANRYTTIAASGGSFNLGPNVTANFAPNTFSTSRTLAYKPIAAQDSEIYVSLDRAFELSDQPAVTMAENAINSVTTNQPYSLTITYDPELIPNTMDITDFSIYTWTSSGWQQEQTTIDQSVNRMTIQTTHIGRFAVLAPRPHVIYLPIARK